MIELLKMALIIRKHVFYSLLVATCDSSISSGQSASLHAPLESEGRELSAACLSRSVKDERIEYFCFASEEAVIRQ